MIYSFQYTTRLVLMLGFVALLFSCHHPTQQYEKKAQVDLPTYEKQRGAHVFGRIDSISLQVLSDTNVDWITLVPYGGQSDYDSPSVRYFRNDSEEYRERRRNRWASQIKLSHELGFKVFLKPHIWMHATSDGKWRSDIFHDNEEDWNTWQDSYRSFILYYAELAEEYDVEMFCVGTELTRLTLEKPAFWETLIQDVRAVYSGQLTYAANWYKEYDSINFWSALDFIGIQAYFPLSNKLNPSYEELRNAWNKRIPEIKKVSDENNRPIIFSEIGYKSSADAAMKPWEWVDYHNSDEKFSPSNQLQADAYKAVFETIWNESWFAGMHLWQWRSDHRDRDGKNYIDFTPQGKPAQKVIAEGYSIEALSKS